MTIDMKDVATNPTKYGFDWTFGHLHTDDKTVRICDNAPLPIMIHGGYEKFVETFGKQRVAQWALGATALRVKIQAVLRKACLKDTKIRNDLPALKLLAVQGMFGVKQEKITTVTVEKEVFTAFDGTKFDNIEDLKKYSILALNAEKMQDDAEENQEQDEAEEELNA